MPVSVNVNGMMEMMLKKLMHTNTFSYLERLV